MYVVILNFLRKRLSAGGSLDFSSFESPPCRVTQDVFIVDGISHILKRYSSVMCEK